MKKYIEADLLKQKVESLFYGEHTCDESYNSGYDDAINDVLDILDNAPTADVQEVVRCKNCKYAIKNQAVFGIVDYKCNLHGVSGFDTEDFCSYGKRKGSEK